MTDIHNRASGLRALTRLVEQVSPDLVVDTGDVSGIPGPWQDLFIALHFRVGVPYVFAPGNHDDGRTMRLMRSRGALVLDRPMTVEVCGIRVWGYPDPNRTRWGMGDRYSNELVARIASEQRPSSGPVLAAVHSERMVHPTGWIPLVLCGHVHTPRIWTSGGATFMRPGSSGGGGPFGSALRFGVVDVDPVSHRPIAAWFIRAEGRRTFAEKVV